MQRSEERHSRQKRQPVQRPLNLKYIWFSQWRLLWPQHFQQNREERWMIRLGLLEYCIQTDFATNLKWHIFDIFNVGFHKLFSVIHQYLLFVFRKHHSCAKGKEGSLPFYYSMHTRNVQTVILTPRHARTV